MDTYGATSVAQDPDGIGSVLPAITSVLFGVLAGILLRRNPRISQRLVDCSLSAATWCSPDSLLSYLDPDQQAALDDVVRGADGRTVLRLMAFWYWVG